MADEKPNLEGAYALETPEDNLALYAEWAETYDQTFAEAMDYRMPQVIGALYAEVAGGKSPVLDVGAGTGLLAEAMPGRETFEIDALDISPDMLAVAGAKGIYRRTIEGDLTGRLPIEDGAYEGVVSAGTFTHGHVGPEALDELMRVARSGAQFVLGVNAQHFKAQGFAAKFDLLEPDMVGFEKRTVPIYGEGAKGDHQHDEAHVVVFTKR